MASSLQIEMLMQRLGELAAFDIDNAAGRYMLNLSRSLDRFMAMRLQVSVGHAAWSSTVVWVRHAWARWFKLDSSLSTECDLVVAVTS